MSVGVLLDRTLVEDLGDQFQVGPEKDLFGVEIELEGRNIRTAKDTILKLWGIHADGSLRIQKPMADACEYTFKKPLNMAQTKAAIADLFQHLNTPPCEVFESYRTSIHIHVNCLNETTRTIVNFLTLAIIFDELFVSQNGEQRVGNNFCLRAKDAEGQIADLSKSYSKYGNLFNINQHDRYSSTNFGALMKFGTIEFRSLECTTDYNRVIHWIETLQALKIAARGYENPKEIIAKFSRRGPVGFTLSTLGAQGTKYTGIPGFYVMLQNGMRLAQDFAFCSDWQLPSPEELKLKKTKNKMYNDILAQAQAMHQAQAVLQAHAIHFDNPIPGWIEPPPQPDEDDPLEDLEEEEDEDED